MQSCTVFAGSSASALEQKAGAPDQEVVAYFVHVWGKVLSLSRFESGCAVLAVTVATQAKGHLEGVRQVFRAWRERLAEEARRLARKRARR